MLCGGARARLPRDVAALAAILYRHRRGRGAPLPAPPSGQLGAPREMEDGELRPMSEEEAAALRARLLELRAASGEPKASARTAYEQLAQEEAFKGFVTSGRVKKAWTRLNAEQREAAEQRHAARALPAVAGALPRWPTGKSIRDTLDKGDTSIFSIDEKLQSHSTGSGLPIGQNAQTDYKMTLTHMAANLDAGRDLFLLENKEETQAVVILVTGLRLQANGTPLFEVEYAHSSRNSPTLAAHLELVHALLGRGKGAVKVSSTIAEQRLFIAELKKHETTAGGPCVHPRLRRSCIPSPPPAKNSEMATRNPGEKVCGFCGGAGRLTCSGCRGVHYCDASCQKKHWKVHRPDCKSQSQADGTSVVIEVVPKQLPEGAPGVHMIMNMRQGAGTRMSTVEEVSHNPHGAKRFLIKVQVPQVGGDQGKLPLMIYDEPRAMQRMLYAEEGEAYAVVRDLVRSRGVMNGAKAYLWAKREGAQLRIFVDAAGMADQHQPW